MISEAKKQWNESHKEHTKKYQREYYLAHRDIISAKAKKYQLAHREEKNAYLRAYYIANKEKTKTSYKIYRQANKERMKLGRKAHYLANVERLKTEQKAYRLANKGRIKKYNKTYASAHLEQRRLSDRKRQALKVGSNHERYTDIYIFERDNWICGVCGRKINKRLKYPNPRSKSIDHIIPLTKGGADAAINLQAAHLRCNIGKGARSGGQLKKLNFA